MSWHALIHPLIKYCTLPVSPHAAGWVKGRGGGEEGSGLGCGGTCFLFHPFSLARTTDLPFRSAFLTHCDQRNDDDDDDADDEDDNDDGDDDDGDHILMVMMKAKMIMMRMKTMGESVKKKKQQQQQQLHDTYGDTRADTHR